MYLPAIALPDPSLMTELYTRRETDRSHETAILKSCSQHEILYINSMELRYNLYVKHVCIQNLTSPVG